MRSLLLIPVLALVGCAQLPAITADVVSEIKCVEAQLGNGNLVYEDIALACGSMAVADVVTIVTSLSTPAVVDAGSDAVALPSNLPLVLAAKKAHHKGSK